VEAARWVNDRLLPISHVMAQTTRIWPYMVPIQNFASSLETRWVVPKLTESTATRSIKCVSFRSTGETDPFVSRGRNQLGSGELHFSVEILCFGYSQFIAFSPQNDLIAWSGRQEHVLVCWKQQHLGKEVVRWDTSVRRIPEYLAWPRRDTAADSARWACCVSGTWPR